jgi:thioredoxin
MRGEEMKIRVIQDQNFAREVLDATTPVLVDFYADWCPPCRRLAPVLEKLATDYGEKVKIVKVNTDEEKLWASKLGVRGLPTVAFFLDGKLVAKEAGVMSYKTLAGAFDILLDNKPAA